MNWPPVASYRRLVPPVRRHLDRVLEPAPVVQLIFCGLERLAMSRGAGQFGRAGEQLELQRHRAPALDRVHDTSAHVDRAVEALGRPRQHRVGVRCLGGVAGVVGRRRGAGCDCPRWCRTPVTAQPTRARQVRRSTCRSLPPGTDAEVRSDAPSVIDRGQRDSGRSCRCRCRSLVSVASLPALSAQVPVDGLVLAFGADGGRGVEAAVSTPDPPVLSEQDHSSSTSWLVQVPAVVAAAVQGDHRGGLVDVDVGLPCRSLRCRRCRRRSRRRSGSRPRC